jgi:ABC-type multidrug transport system ATPase subunit
MNAVYEIEELVKIYPGQSRPANDHISLCIEAGEIFGLLGDNGAGKSTLVLQMANLLASTSGKITFLGKPVGSDPLHIPLNAGYMPQDGGAINNLTVGEALFFTAHLRGLSRRDALAERDRLLEVWQVGRLRDQPGPRLSGGERRLMLLALIGIGPVVIPPDQLPGSLRVLGWFSPVTYAASALRQARRQRAEQRLGGESTCPVSQDDGLAGQVSGRD